MKRLTLIRHAKAEPPERQPDDHRRELTERGRRAAKALGRMLRDARPDLVLCSTATRTRETWAGMARALEGAPEPEYDPRLYLATAGGLLARVNAQPAVAGWVWIIGHNPGLQDLLRFLLDETRIEPEAAAILQGFPTAAWATLRFEADAWDHVTSGRGILEACGVPSKHGDDG